MFQRYRGWRSRTPAEQVALAVRILDESEVPVQGQVMGFPFDGPPNLDRTLLLPARLQLLAGSRVLLEGREPLSL